MRYHTSKFWEGLEMSSEVAELMRYHMPKSIDEKINPRAYVDRVIFRVPAKDWAQILSFGFVEVSAGCDDWKTGTPVDPDFKMLIPSDPTEKRKQLSAEIANGRLAMKAVMDRFFQDGLTGSA